MNEEKYVLDKETIFSPVYHPLQGLCYTLDIRKDFNFMEPKIDQGLGMTLSISFTNAQNYPSISGLIYMHGSQDLPASKDHSPFLPFAPYSTMRSGYTIKKSILTSQSTKDKPCSEHYQDTCLDMKLQEFVLQKYACFVPFLYTGFHLGSNMQRQPSCLNKTILLEAFEMRSKLADGE